MADHREAVAAKLLRAIQRAGLEGSRYLPERFEIEVEGGGRLNLENAAAEYERAGFLRRGAVLRRWVAFAREAASGTIPKSIDEARANIIPIVRNQAFFANLDLQIADGEIRPSPPVQPLAADLTVSLAYDGKLAIAGLNAPDLDAWGISVDEAMKIARYNIRMRTPDGLREISPGLHVSPYRDNHDGSRVVLTEVISRLSVQGDPVAFVPHRDVLIVTGTDDRDNLVNAAEMAMEALDDPRIISGRAICFQAGGWRPFMATSDSPAHEPMRRLALKTAALYYEGQRELLQKREGEQTFVGKFGAGTESTGRWYSWAVWAEDVPTWLPITDKLFLVSPRTEEQDTKGPWDWSVVAKVAGDLMQPRDTIPARMFVDRFPTDEMVREIVRAHRT